MKKIVISLSFFLLVVVSFFLYINRFVFVTSIKIDGYAVDGKTLASNLINGVTPESTTVKIDSVDFDDNVYKSGNNYYYGEQKKKNIDIKYPIISKDTMSLFVVSDNGALIDEKFNRLPSFSDIIIVNGQLYGGNNFVQLDNDKYYFLELENGIYVNLLSLKIYNAGNLIEIAENSFISLDENYIRFYTLVNDELVFNESAYVTKGTKVKIDEFEGTYIELLKRIGKYQIVEELIREDIGGKITNGNTEGNVKDGKDNEKIIYKEEDYDYLWKDKEYIKPEVSIANIKIKTYSFIGTLSIYDPSLVIVKSPTFTFKENGKVYLRKTFNVSNEIKVEGLKPETTYQVEGSYIYYNEKGQKVQKIFYVDEITTLNTDSIGTIKIDYDNITSTSDSFAINNLHFENNSNDDVLNGIKKVKIKYGRFDTYLNIRDIRNLTSLSAVDFTSSSVLQSNTFYNGEIIIYDTADNVMKVENASFSFTSKKALPIANISVQNGKNFTTATILFDINNIDDVNVLKYQYVIFDADGKEIAREIITENTKRRDIDNLESGKKYYIMLYCDYVDDDNIDHKNTLIASTEFLSYDVERLGKIFLDIKYQNATDTMQKADISYRNTDEIFDILYGMLSDNIVLKVINNKTDDVLYSTIYNKNSLIGIGSTFVFDNLISNTEYRIEFEFKIISGENEFIIATDYGNKNVFKTNKQAPSFIVENLFIADGFIDFDAIIYDKDSAIVFEDNADDRTVTLDVYDKSENKVYSKPLEITNGNLSDYNQKVVNRININNLDDGGEYLFKVTAKNYNNGQISQSNYEINYSRRYVLSGLSGGLNLDKMIKSSYYDVLNGSAEGKNLFDIANRSRWKSSGDSSTTPMLTLDVDNNIVEIAANNGGRRYNYYIPEIYQKDSTSSVTVSFDVKREEGTSTVFCLINGASGTCSGNSNASNITNVTNEYKRVDMTFNKVNSDGYISFYIGETVNKNLTTKFSVKNLEIVIGSEANTSYESFNDNGQYVGLFNLLVDEPENISGIPRQIIDNSNIEPDIINGDEFDVYVRIKCNGEKCPENNLIYEEKVNYDEFPYNGDIEVINIIGDASYTGYLSIYVSNDDFNRIYDISTIKFSSDSEIRTISSPQDLFSMHTNGYYIVTNDLDLRNVCKSYSGTFQGSIDFQGHKLLVDNCSTYVIQSLGGNGVVKNVDVHYYLNSPKASIPSGYSGLFSSLYGKLSNIMITLESSIDKLQSDYSLIAESNFGTIENFVINSKASLIGHKEISLGVRWNYGAIKNGYVYGENILSIYSSNTSTSDAYAKNVGAIASSSYAGSVIKNIYSLIDVEINEEPTNKDKVVGSIIGSASNAIVKNILSFHVEDNITRDKTKDAILGSGSSLTTSNLYYVSSNKYSGTFAKQIMAKSFNDPLFLDNVLNEEGAFDTKEAFKLKIFPHIIWPDVMPAQEYLIIPSDHPENDLALISVDEIEYLDNDPNYLAKVLFTFHNENLAKITGLEIEGISNIEVIDQAHNRNSKTTLLYALIGYPSVYKSNYKLEKIITNIYNVTVDTNIQMDLYYPVENLQDIANNLSKHENFRLVKDIDCSVTSCPTTNLGTIKGKIDGDNHTIKNFETNGCYINTLNGTLQNITFENYKVLGNKNNQGLICTMKNATVSNVYLINEELTIGVTSSNKNVYVGGLAARAERSLIENSGINRIKLHDNNLGGAAIWYGSFVGEASYLSIENSFVRNINFNMIKDVNNASSGNATNNNSRGIGGIIGAMSYGNVSNVYATGKMETDMGIIGGIVGINSNGYIDSVMANVNILASQDEVGEINGRSISNTNPKRENSISKSVAIGSISVLIDNPSFFGRTSGSVISMNGNYAWDKQQLNSKISNNSSGEYLLSTSDLSNSNIYESRIGFNTKFFALNSDFVPAYMPYLKSKDGKILKEQGYEKEESVEDRWIHYIETLSYLSSEFNYHYTEGMENDVNKEYYAEYAYATVKINNPNYYTITNVNISGMRISNFRAVTSYDGITTINFNAIPVRYLDSYNLDKIEYTTGTNNEAVYPSIVIDLKFYGRLTKAEDWNRLIKGSLENYVVLNDIDFEHSNNCNYSISFNNLIGIIKDGKNPVIKNIGTHEAPLYFSSAGDSLIDTLVSDIRNIEFENIYIYNRATSGNYTGIIKFLNGMGRDLVFNNVEVLAPKNSYVGLVSYNQSSDFRNIIMNSVNISGVSYVGGLIGRSMSRDVTNVQMDGVTIRATGDYVGGLIGYEAWDSKIHTYQITANNMNVVNSANKTYLGGVFGYGTGNVVTISNSYVEGYNRVGGISGQDGNSSSQYNFVNNVTVVGRGSYIGGATGINTTRYYTYVTDTTVHCRSTLTGTCSGSYVGGIAGGGAGSYTILYSGIKDSNIMGGSYVGGIKGYLGGYNYLYGNYVKDTNVTGNSSVGGIAGSVGGNNNYIYLNTTNATVEAKTANAGGVIGYVNNNNTTNANYRTYIYRNIVANASVKAPNYSGGLIGRVNKALYSGRYYSNVISANVTCTNDNCLAGYVIGTTDEYASNITKLKVYENSSLTRGNIDMTTLVNDQNTTEYLKSFDVMITRDKLEDFNMYKNTLSFSTSYYETSKGYFPRIKSINNSYGNYKVDFELPEITSTRNLMKRSEVFHLMPDVSVYPVDVDKINIEFSFVDESTSFEINKKTYIINQKTFTFYYNYLEDFTITLNDGINEKVINIDHETLKNKILIDGDNYYILNDNGEIVSNVNINYNAEKMNANGKYLLKKLAVMMIDTEKTKGVNIYYGKILLDNGNIYDIEKEQVILNYVDNLTIVETKPLYEYNYANQKIKTFETYSTVDDKYISKRIIVHDGQIEILSNEIQEKTSNILADYYNGKNYLIYLDDNSVIHSVKEKIVYPEDFQNYEIAAISFNREKEDHLLLVKYKNNDYILFNYLTGEVKAKKRDYVPNLYEYTKNYLKDSLKLNDNSVYEEAKKELENIIKNEKKLNENNSYESSDYSIVYNPISQSYDIYEISNNAGKKKDLASVVNNASLSREIVNNNLNNNYNIAFGIRYDSLSSIVIISVLLLMIAIAVFILWKNIRKTEKK